MKKQTYNTPVFDVVIFDENDIITASTTNYIPDRDDPIELPFIPAK